MLVRYYHHYLHFITVQKALLFPPFRSTWILRFSQLYMSCMSFICPCRTSRLQRFTVSVRGVSTAGGIVHGSRSICRLSQSCTLLPSLPLPPKSCQMRFFPSALLCALSFCRKALFFLQKASQSIAWIFTGEFSHRILWKCDPSWLFKYWFYDLLLYFIKLRGKKML